MKVSSKGQYEQEESLQDKPVLMFTGQIYMTLSIWHTESEIATAPAEPVLLVFMDAHFRQCDENKLCKLL